MPSALVHLLLWLTPWLSQAGNAARQSAPSQGQSWVSALRAIVASEHAFARRAGMVGTRDAFLAFIAEDAVLFRPEPVAGKKYLLDHPASPGKLSWRPVFADVSVSADLGYTTGPYEYRKEASDPAPSSYGNYFTVWRKQQDGSWKFVIDYGTGNPAPTKLLPDFDVGQAKPPSLPKGGSTAEKAAAGLVEFEQKLSDIGEVQGTAAREASIAADARFLRQDRQPAVGLAEIHLLMNAEQGSWTWEPIRAQASIAGDLGYTYGACAHRAAGSKGNPPRSCHYLRVYRRQPDGSWRIKAEVVNF